MDGLLFGSEAEGQTSFHADVEIFIEVDLVRCDCSQLAVCTETLSQTNSSADLTGQFGCGVATVGEDESRTALDVPSSVATKVAFVTHVGLEEGGAVVTTNEAAVGLDVYVRTCEGWSSQGGSRSSGSKDSFHDFS